MAIFRCSMFGQVVYDDRLTYQELLETEALVTSVMQGALERSGARHIGFTPEADALLVECVFADMDRDAHRSLCDELIRQLGSNVSARFAFVDHRINSVVFSFLNQGRRQEQVFDIPAPREALSGRTVRREDASVSTPRPRTTDDGRPATGGAVPSQSGKKTRQAGKNDAQTADTPKKRSPRKHSPTP